MGILEIVRLILEDMGVGLLPIASAALVCVLVTLWLQRTKRTGLVSATLSVYWLAYGVVMAIKCVRLHTLDLLHPAKGSKYPSNDWWLDCVVMTCLFFLFFLFECTTFTLLIIKRHQRRQDHDVNRSDTPLNIKFSQV